MKKIVVVMAVLAAVCCQAAKSAKPWIKGVTDKSPIEYKVGETMKFTLTLERAVSLPKGLDIVWTRTGDDGKMETGKVPADESKPLMLTTSIDRPGFVRIYAILSNSDGTPMSTIRVGVVGVGARGAAAAKRLATIPGVEVVAICDIRTDFAERSAQEVEKITSFKPAVFAGAAESFKGLCDMSKVDVVYNCTSWDAHAMVSLYAMEAGKHTMVEVPSVMRIDDCWAMVETAERTRCHCMQLENCCYGENEMLALNLCRLGMFGELLHGEGAYIHDRRWQIFNDRQWERWRNHWNEKHSGNQYPTHGLGPIALDMGINRGDRFDYLVSVDGVQRGYEAFAAATLPDGNPGRSQRFAMADMNVTTIRTALGRTIMLQHDVTSPRPYSRINLIAGTKGMLRSYPQLEVYFEGANEWPQQGAHKRLNVAEDVRLKFQHPLYKVFDEIAKKAGGHGGMDFMMDVRWVYCMRKGLPLDMDVYDLASWCAVCELSERSAKNRSATVDFPDFTRGAWRKKCNSNLMDATMDVSGDDFEDIGKIKGQMSV